MSSLIERCRLQEKMLRYAAMSKNGYENIYETIESFRKTVETNDEPWFIRAISDEYYALARVAAKRERENEK